MCLALVAALSSSNVDKQRTVYNLDVSASSDVTSHALRLSNASKFIHLSAAAQTQHGAVLMIRRALCIVPSAVWAGPSWSSNALRYDVAFFWSINPFFHNGCSLQVD
jgi:hypothetical protein